MFDAYNRCDLKAFGAYYAEDLEFYHDESGLTRGRPALVEAIQKNICGKVHRDLVPGTLVVYPLNKYGAVELGSHLFCDPHVKRRCDAADELASYIHLWNKRGDVWTITRVISYDHHNPSP
jgi:ketosteroid isomerase-like protein